MPQRPSCADCPEPEFIHPCRNCCPQPLCKNDNTWAPTYCIYCIQAAQAWCREDGSKRCSFLKKKREYFRVRAYQINPFSKQIDLIAFQCIIGANEKHLGITEHDSMWTKSFLRRVCDTALKSSHPYEVFKLANQLFTAQDFEFDQNALIQRANNLKTLSPPRQSERTSRSSSRGEKQIDEKIQNSRKQLHSKLNQAENQHYKMGAQKTIESTTSDPLSISVKYLPCTSLDQRSSSNHINVEENDEPNFLIENSRENIGNYYIPEKPTSYTREDSHSDSENDDIPSVNSERMTCPSSDEEGQFTDIENESRDGHVSEVDDQNSAPRSRSSSPENLRILTQKNPDSPNPNRPGFSNHSPIYSISPPPENRDSPRNSPSKNNENTVNLHSNDNNLTKGVYLTKSPKFVYLSNSRVVNEAIAKIVFQTREDSDYERPAGWYLISNTFTFDKSLFHYRHVGELTIINPTTEGLASPHFMTLFNSFREYVESDNEKTKRQREHVYNQMMALFHKDTDNTLKEKLGWSRGKNNKQITSSKIPPPAADAVNNKPSPPRRSVKPGLFFVGNEGTPEAAFLKTLNCKHSCRSVTEGSMFRGSFWHPKREAEDNLEQSRCKLQNISNCIMGSQAISDIAEAATSAPVPRQESDYKDLLVKIKALSDENIRLLEPSLATGINDYSYKKREVRSQMVKGLAPSRVRDPLMQAPIFSEDINVFPIAAIKEANTLALTAEMDLVLPKQAYREKSRPNNKRPLEGKSYINNDNKRSKTTHKENPKTFNKPYKPTTPQNQQKYNTQKKSNQGPSNYKGKKPYSTAEKRNNLRNPQKPNKYMPGAKQFQNKEIPKKTFRKQ